MKKLIIQHWKVFIESNLFVVLVVNIAKIYARYNKTAEEEYANPADNLGFFLQKIF